MSQPRLLKKLLQDLAAAALLGVVCMLIVELLELASSKMVRSPLQAMEDEVVDLSFHLRKTGAEYKALKPEDVVIIAIDDYSIEQLGRAQSWPRSYDARVINYVASGYPKAIGIDFLYTESDSLGSGYLEKMQAEGMTNVDLLADAMRSDDELAQAIDSAGCVYLSFFDDDSKAKDSLNSAAWSSLNMLPLENERSSSAREWVYPVLPITQFASAAKGIGGIAVPTSYDGTVRQYQLIQRTPRNHFTDRAVGNFPLYMMLDAKGIGFDEVKITEGGLMHKDSLLVPLNTDGSFRINWLGSEEKIRYISYYKVWDELVPAEFFENKYVFFGASASGLQDLKTVPSRDDKMPGVEVHATAFLNMMNGSFLQEPSPMQVRVAYYLIAVLMILIFLLLRPLFGVIAAFVLYFVFRFAFELWVLPEKGIIVPIAMLMTLTLVCYVASVLYSYFIRERRTRFLKNAFGAYLSPEVVNQITGDSEALQLGGQKKELTVLFSDIRDFTYFSERFDSQQTVAFLNHYLSAMSEVIFRHQGTIDKFIGDAIMAIFGAPVPQTNHAEKACLVALEMVAELHQVNLDNAKLGFPKVAIGIGINTGDMTIGNIGSKRRFDYTVIGDAVNLGARLEGLTKFFDVQIIVSEHTRQSVVNPSLLFRELGNVVVKGKEHPVKIYQLLPPAENEQELILWLQHWERAFDWMESRNLPEAIECLKCCQAIMTEDLATYYYLKSCEAYLNSPEAFDLLIRMESK
jgi:adenylate cyclase